MFDNDLLKELKEISVTNSSVHLILWNHWTSPIIIGCLFISGIVSLGLKGFIVKYVIRDAPKNRPVNLLIMFDQVISELLLTLEIIT